MVALTDAEFHAMAATADVTEAIRLGMGVTGNDWLEIMANIHAIQRAIMAQAACRAYPERYRLLQGTFDEASLKSKEKSIVVATPVIHNVKYSSRPHPERSYRDSIGIYWGLTTCQVCFNYWYRSDDQKERRKRILGILRGSSR